jgi:hypothetical protein
LYLQTRLSEGSVNNSSICALSVSGLKQFFGERVPLHWLGLNMFTKMATKATVKKAAPGSTKKVAGATKTKPKVKK